MKIGILEILTFQTRSFNELCFNTLIMRQYSSIMPQTISYWCRSLGHKVYYNTYYGVKDLLKRLPTDLDFVFVSCPTHLSLFAYTIAKFYQNKKTLTVIGGPHAKCYPKDSLKFFDFVVKDCDKSLIQNLLNKEYPIGSIVDTHKPLVNFPTVQQRYPEIKNSFLYNTSFFSVIPYLTSIGCTNKCPFCVDWNSSYQPLPIEQIKEDFTFISKNIPSAILGFHDPNFGTNINEILDLMLSLNIQNKHVMECSLDAFTPTVLHKLQKTNCVLAVPGIESWTGYAQKSGFHGGEKIEYITNILRKLQDTVSYIQANFIFGLDSDSGKTPLELTSQLCQNIPSI